MSQTRILIKGTLFQGIAGPMLFNSQGNLALLQDHQLVQNELVMWLLTGITETFMEPQDGVGLDEQLFDPGDDTTFIVLQSFIKNRLDELEQRVELIDVKIKRLEDSGDESKVVAIITYKIPALIDTTEEGTYSIEVGVGTVA